MRKSVITIMAGLSLLASPAVWGRTILTPEAAADYDNRLADQPAISAALAIPSGLTSDEEDALRFLYAYMATPDALDYDGDFYLENVRMALKADAEMPWAASVPDREWRHFVLPLRVNNENLDGSRKVFYEELKDRVKGLTMEEAVLEVNHWCHEKVSYQPSDARTSSPLATVCNALGRCGEESTFTVAALRSVGIPARQVYTIRWAHTDDNHAWVEAWVDGKWRFFGACEPEPVLDMAWFNEPATRGMLMSTNVTGRYDGPEEKLEVNPVTTSINVTENYAPVAKSVVRVTDRNGAPVEGAEVRFCLYNYAEYFPLVVKTTGSDGQADFITGIGDMVAWATDGTNFNLTKLHAGETVELVLDKDGTYSGTMEFDLVPPAPGAGAPAVTPEAVAANDRRKAYEDSVRLAYVGTFITPEEAQRMCRELSLDSVAAGLLVNSRGNRKVITDFLTSQPADSRARAVALLASMAEKDLHDVTPEVLDDSMNHTPGEGDSPLFAEYVLNPRIDTEMLRPYKEYIRETLSGGEVSSFRHDPREIARYLDGHITPDRKYNPGELRQSARSTLQYRTADPLNRDILFVAICRSIGVPAEIDPVTGAVRFADATGAWQEVTFKSDRPESDGAQESSETQGSVLCIADGSEQSARQPKYYSQFTISRVDGGRPELMEFDDFESVESINSRRYPLGEGQYMMVSGQRLADGTVLARTNFFVADGRGEVTPELVVRQDPTALQVIGSLNAELTYVPFVPGGERTEKTGEGHGVTLTVAEPERSILSTVGRGYYVLGVILPGHEPSAHALNDIAAAAEEIEATGRKVLLLLPDAEAAANFRVEDYGKLPQNVFFGIDKGGVITEAIKEGLELPELTSSDMPLFVVADSFNRIISVRKGYTIHLGDELARVLNAARQ